ncbi:hypothetical protein [Adlercreutzia murintestinalis]|uniref:hypothetical protein n=1 Tax=Adlercreutzia murintestinalis TaxID=2941325 RepID=UPI00203FAE85|nr:hypothetical protein [Adlercreutzia murintestinalis]
MTERMGKRCAVCVGCGKCFQDETTGNRWSGARCAICVGCGVCAQAWGLVAPEDGEVDAVSGATDWASAFKAMDCGQAGDVPECPAPPGAPSCDAATGATPGVASACRDLGLDDMASVLTDLGIKPPGVS